MNNEPKPHSGEPQSLQCAAEGHTKTLKLVSVQTYATNPNRGPELVRVRHDQPEQAPNEEADDDSDDAPSDDE